MTVFRLFRAVTICMCKQGLCFLLVFQKGKQNATTDKDETEIII